MSLKPGPKTEPFLGELKRRTMMLDDLTWTMLTVVGDENASKGARVAARLAYSVYQAGHVLKDGATWGEGKQDVTGAACGAVCEHVLANGEPVMVTCNGTPKYEITVREL